MNQENLSSPFAKIQISFKYYCCSLNAFVTPKKCTHSLNFQEQPFIILYFLNGNMDSFFSVFSRNKLHRQYGFWTECDNFLIKTNFLVSLFCILWAVSFPGDLHRILHHIALIQLFRILFSSCATAEQFGIWLSMGLHERVIIFLFFHQLGISSRRLLHEWRIPKINHEVIQIILPNNKKQQLLYMKNQIGLKAACFSIKILQLIYLQQILSLGFTSLFQNRHESS